jgi:hypothetical protein
VDIFVRLGSADPDEHRRRESLIEERKHDEIEWLDFFRAVGDKENHWNQPHPAALEKRHSVVCAQPVYEQHDVAIVVPLIPTFSGKHS